jgi:hypothetical protein
VKEDNDVGGMQVILSGYLKYRAKLRGFDLNKIEEIVRFSDEKYFDTATGRMVVIGKHNTRLVMVPYEMVGNTANLITVHAITRQQITFRLKNGRFIYE